jgi:sugar/nucleoside kinase (ribokinase family)
MAAWGRARKCRAAYIGKVRDDQLGQVFRHDIRAAGVAFDSVPATDGPPTARCLILVTPDAQRTMNTFLGACVNLGPEDVPEALIASASITYMEGYLWDRPKAKEAFVRAAKLAHGAKRRVSLTLSDPFCVDRHRDSFRALVKDHIDILFANEAEIASLYQVNDFDQAVKQVRQECEIAVVTRGAEGSVILKGGEMHVVPAAPVAKVVDTTGAGDLYAAGFLQALTAGHDLKRCGQVASLAAAEAISHYGARPETDLKKLVKEKLG